MTRKELGALLIEKEFDEDVESDGEQIKNAQKKMRNDLFLVVRMYKNCGSKIKTFQDMHVLQDN